MGIGGIAWASSHAFGVTLLEGEACSSRLKAAPQAQRSVAFADYDLCLLPQVTLSFLILALGSFLLFRIPNSAIRIPRMTLLEGEACSSSGAILKRSDQRFVPFAPWREKFSNLARKARVA